MKFKWFFSLALAFAVVVNADARSSRSNGNSQSKAKTPVYKALTLKEACEYLIAQGVACAPEIRIQFPKTPTQEEIETLAALLGTYRLAAMEVSPDPNKKELLVFTPQYYSCVRMLKAFRDPDSIELTDKETEALEAAKSVLDELNVDALSSIDKAQEIHDWIVENCSYDNGSGRICPSVKAGNDFVVNNTRGAYFANRAARGTKAGKVTGSTPLSPSAGSDSFDPTDGKYLLLERKGLSDSYAQAYWLLLQMAGVPSAMMCGKNVENEQTHIWNLVYLGDHWAHVDVALDDSSPDEPGRTSSKYFDKTDEEMEEYRSWDKKIFPNSEATQLFSPETERVVLDTEKDFFQFIRDQELRTDMEFSVEITDLEKSKSFDDELQKLAKEVQIGGSISCTQDPFFPHAIRVKFHKENDMKKQ